MNKILQLVVLVLVAIVAFRVLSFLFGLLVLALVIAGVVYLLRNLRKDKA